MKIETGAVVTRLSVLNVCVDDIHPVKSVQVFPENDTLRLGRKNISFYLPSLSHGRINKKEI